MRKNLRMAWRGSYIRMPFAAYIDMRRSEREQRILCFIFFVPTLPLLLLVALLFYGGLALESLGAWMQRAGASPRRFVLDLPNMITERVYPEWWDAKWKPRLDALAKAGTND